MTDQEDTSSSSIVEAKKQQVRLLLTDLDNEDCDGDGDKNNDGGGSGSSSSKSDSVQNEAAAVMFHHGLHCDYIRGLSQQLDRPESYEGAVTEHLRMSGAYWSLTAYSLLLPLERVQHEMTTGGSLLDWVMSCFDEKSGGFGGNVGQDGHLLYTLSAVQILAVTDQLHLRLTERHVESIVQFVVKLQNPDDGSFSGDAWGEIDTRFSYCAVATLAILNRLDAINVTLAADYVGKCWSAVDGGFGAMAGAESHAGQVFCCIAALSITKSLDRFLLKNNNDNINNNKTDRVDLLSWWLAERQVDSGGLNGRPEKQADVCYSWWILSSLSILGRLSFLHRAKLARFIGKCQDDESGGIADRPEDMVDVFHTFFGIAGLSLLGYLHTPYVQQQESYRSIDPVYALPTDIVQKLKLPGQVFAERPGDKVDPRLSHYDVVYLHGNDKIQ